MLIEKNYSLQEINIAVWFLGERFEREVEMKRRWYMGKEQVNDDHVICALDALRQKHALSIHSCNFQG